MCALDKWIETIPKEDQCFVTETLSELWDVFCDLKQKGYLRPTLRSEQRRDFAKIFKTSDELSEVFNMLFRIPTVKGEFVNGRNKEFVEHNREYGFNEKRYVYLLLSESISVFLRNVELFRSCFLFFLKTTKRHRKGRKEFYHTMGIGELLNQLVIICGSKGEKIKNKIDCELRNGLTHGLMWTDESTIHYSKDITFAERGKIGLDDLWMKAIQQSKVTQCLIHSVLAWYGGN